MHDINRCHCGTIATWKRRAIRGVVKYFCNNHAPEESDFGAEGVDFRWEKIDLSVSKIHPVDVFGFDGDLNELAHFIFTMRYDKVIEFLEHTIDEIDRQSQGDRERGRTQLAELLTTASDEMFQLKCTFDEIFALCEPYMKHELT